jgi:hypothetical protein
MDPNPIKVNGRLAPEVLRILKDRPALSEERLVQNLTPSEMETIIRG